MENASKALIIAGAILISILIIGLGVYFYNMAASTGKKVDLTSQEAQAQNEQFQSYFGNRRSAAEVKALMGQITSNNITGASSDENKKIFVLFNGNITTPSAVNRQVKAGTTYWIGTLNDEAPKDAAEETEDVTTADEKTPAYYSNAYLRIICVNPGGAPAGAETDEGE